MGQLQRQPPTRSRDGTVTVTVTEAGCAKPAASRSSPPATRPHQARRLRPRARPPRPRRPDPPPHAGGTRPPQGPARSRGHLGRQQHRRRRRRIFSGREAALRQNGAALRPRRRRSLTSSFAAKPLKPPSWRLRSSCSSVSSPCWPVSPEPDSSDRAPARARARDRTLTNAALPRLSASC